MLPASSELPVPVTVTVPASQPPAEASSTPSNTYSPSPWPWPAGSAGAGDSIVSLRASTSATMVAFASRIASTSARENPHPPMMSHDFSDQVQVK